MASAYTPGLEVTPYTTIVKVRELPLPGRTLVAVGDKVTADTDVLITEIPGEIDIIRVADRVGLDPFEVVDGMKCKAGDSLKRGDVICEVKTFFGLFTARLLSPAEGTVEFFTEANAHLGVRQDSTPLSVKAYVAGHVTAIENGKSVTVETRGALIQGIFGVGGERHGLVLPLAVEQNAIVTAEKLSSIADDLRGKIIFGGARFTADALAEVAKRGARAVVTGSIDAPTLAKYVGFEIGVSITGDEEVPFTLIITEGFGQLAISPRIMELAIKLQGRAASVNGATQVRAGAMRPEVIIPQLENDVAGLSKSGLARSLEVGSRIRIIRVPYFGVVGTITDLPHQPVAIPSGAHVRVLQAELETGERVLVPRANVELL